MLPITTIGAMDTIPEWMDAALCVLRSRGNGMGTLLATILLVFLDIEWTSSTTH
jgi:hypothetical protein